MPDWTVHHADCLDAMRAMDAASVDAIVTDPPYGLKFMGKAWDHGVPGVEFWVEALRVARPGAHLLAFGGTRTFHRLAVAIEDAGWEVRDTLMWLYGQGFPKSLDVSKAIDKEAGAERVVVQTIPDRWAGAGRVLQRATQTERAEAHITAPATEAAKRWDGWGTALKPAWEPIIMARTPMEGTVARNVQRHGTGAINVDGCRIPIADGDGWDVPQPDMRIINPARAGAANNSATEGRRGEMRSTPNGGRWPANVVLDEVAGEMVDAQSGESRDGWAGGSKFSGNVYNFGATDTIPHAGYGGGGGASRFFYCPKASRDDRNEGVERNHHATVKPTELMRWLVRLVTRPGGVVLDPFCGSGSTGVACAREGMRFIGVEKEAEYVAIARARITEANNHLFGSNPCP